MMIRVSCILFLAHLLTGISCNQEFSTEPANVEVTPGHNTTLDCTISNLKGQCRWQKDGKPVGMFPGKYEMRREGEGEGDCSLSVLNVDLKFDDGLWECQVTSSSFQAQDSLVSRKARLTVRVPPEMITIQYSGSSVVEGGIITLVEDKQENIVCITRFSNPAPIISWRLGGNIYPSISQENFTEAVPSKFRSEGTLVLAFTQKNQGERLECVVSHPAYLEGDGSTHVEIDVLYKPRVEITRVSNTVVEEGIGSVALTCSAVGNPPPRVLWTRFGEDKPQYVETLEFNPVTRQNAGSYICSAENTIGKSNQETTQVDVLYAPEIVSLSPRETVLVMARNQTKLTCTASGNPEPKYQWLQLQQSQVVKKRSVTPDLILEDVNYEDQGEYVCEAVNMIGGEKRVVRSEVVKVEVEGVPLVTRMVSEVVAVSGRDVRLEAEFCSDPLPLRNTWEWEDVSLPAGTEIERSGTKYTAELEEHPSNKDCYISRLTLKGVGQADSRSYTLNVENMHGTDLAPVKLAVRDPVSMASVIGVVIALLITFVLLSIILLVAYKKQKLCFKDGDLDALEKSKSNKYSSYNGIDVKDISPIKDKQTAFPPSTKV